MPTNRVRETNRELSSEATLELYDKQILPVRHYLRIVEAAKV